MKNIEAVPGGPRKEATALPLNLMFKALADPTRRKIILLLRDGDLTAGQIADHFPISKPSVSRHLALLRQAGLILDERQGQNIVYSLNTTVFQDVVEWIFEATGTRPGKKDGGGDPSGEVTEHKSKG